jgi:hypothetical protein
MTTNLNEYERAHFSHLIRQAVTHEYRPEVIMKSSTRDKAEVKLHEVKGKVKETAGKLTDNPKLEAEGGLRMKVLFSLSLMLAVVAVLSFSLPVHASGQDSQIESSAKENE